jgi:ABC-2 type transport system ATP-binding protein
VSAPVVEVDGVSKWFGGVVAVSDVSFSIPVGVTALLGPNGAGKSTMLRMLCGLARPSKGTVRVLGRDPRTDVDVTALIGLAPQQESVFEPLTARAFVRATAVLHGLPDPDAAAVSALRTVELDPDDARRLPTYSKGMRQRVKLAQAIVHEPQLLILDEPLAGMDPLARRRTIRLIREWARAGKSIIVSSHILHEIESMTGNILLINNGRILAEGDVHHIRDLIDEHPHTVYVRADDPRALAREFLSRDDVRSLKFEPGAVVVETGKPDLFYARLTEMAASGEFGSIDEVTSPDDNLQAVFKYLVKQ